MEQKRKTCGAVIVAAGSASRMGGIDKVMASLGGEPMIVRTVRAFQNSPQIDEIVIVTRQDLIQPIMDYCGGFDKVQTVTVGGESRQESVEIGLSVLTADMEMVAVHDGARPLVTQEVIARTVRAAASSGAAAPAIPVKDTIKQVEGETIIVTPDRNCLRAGQTPQVFQVQLLKKALQKAKEDQAVVTDDCAAVERLGVAVRLVEGQERNLKVTTPMDLKIAELWLEEEL
ncbi:MAG: 2-C-methyl-D-erythritol 4-phosphate cytidylyltransferase [Ruminococcaceae bacterium]|nr:2-C-methyl-D-erythritol 4-phosphate cytidylyltransferase [Oscillospiraceae bacterium]